MEVMQKVLSFLVVLGVLVVFHELGHYLVARWCNVKVLRFSVGFGRVVWSRRYGPDATEFAVSAIPLGGYVKMADERDPEIAPQDRARAFNRAGVWQRIAIVAAGPVANLLLAVLLYAATFMAGIPGQKPVLAEPAAGSAAAAASVRAGDLVTAVDGTKVASVADLRWRLLKASGNDDVALEVRSADGREATRVVSLRALGPGDWEGLFMQKLGLAADLGPPLVDLAVPGKPAERAGLRNGDRIVAVDGRAVRSPSDVAAATNAKPGAEVVFRVERDGGAFDVPIVPEATESNGKRIGIAGLRLRVDPAFAERLATTVRYGPVEALGQGVRKTWELSTFTLKMLGRIVTGDASLKNISGPITLADYAGQSAQAGALVFVGYLALISISLGVLNLLPIPLLDGGQLLYYFAEVLRGRPLSDRAFEVGQRIGMAVLAALMALALFNDFTRLF
ncbi:MAG TPA: RIP metalloprotease RseP [Casimicrobiaceae bacterium]|nr:RIP metalloprotease RseP [Casimicrobiaceae bacterium]